MSAYANNQITVPAAMARAISAWKETSYAAVLKEVESNLSGRMLQRRTGATLADVKQESGLEPFGFRLKTTTPHLIARQKGSRRKGFWVRPVNAKALSWVSQGQRYFSKGHFIPPWRFPVQPVFADAIDRQRSNIHKTLERELLKALHELFPDVRVVAGD